MGHLGTGCLSVGLTVLPDWEWSVRAGSCWQRWVRDLLAAGVLGVAPLGASRRGGEARVAACPPCAVNCGPIVQLRVRATVSALGG